MWLLRKSLLSTSKLQRSVKSEQLHFNCVHTQTHTHHLYAEFTFVTGIWVRGHLICTDTLQATASPAQLIMLVFITTNGDTAQLLHFVVMWAMPTLISRKISVKQFVISSKGSWKYSWEIILQSIISHLLQKAQEALQELKWNHSNQLNLSWAIRSKEHTVHSTSTPTSSIIFHQFLWILF